ncbi:amidoligase family protein [Salipiger bermudensis]|uniref:amidoligase family protein n=1 Tax=Salipiger bermudensis TaxID=344736 RepID=UPI001CD670A5|nr:amidoligase family protein [Salipiger bermudensis]MCA0963337.1 amidoligase family protein [Salipiger bermudensis]
MSQTSETPPELMPLPHPRNAEGNPRRVGVEVEFSGLTEEKAARVLAETLGGAASEEKPGEWSVTGTGLGDFECYLDSAPLNKMDRDGIGKPLRELARSVVPVEIVTDPVEIDQIPALDEALAALAKAGATGTSRGVLLGFGVHFNPEVSAPTFEAIAPVLTAYALLEDHLRRSAGIDISRRMLPWVDPYPRNLIDRLAAEDAPSDMTSLIDTYLKLAPSRNHGLDMLCLFAHIDKDRVARVMSMEQIQPRPTYHWRLPDCRIDEPGWSLALEWNRWVLVERVAADEGLLQALKEAWRDHRDSLTSIRSDWARRVSSMVMSASP